MTDPSAPTAVAPGPSRAFGLKLATGAFLTGLLLSVLGLSIGFAATGRTQADGADIPLGIQTVSQVGFWLGIAVLPLAVLARRHRGRVREILGLHVRPIDVPLGIAVGVASTVVTTLIYIPFQTKALRHQLSQPAEKLVGSHPSTALAITLVLTVCVLTPICEELFFRGLLFRSLRRGSGLAVAALAGGLVFGLAHLELLQLPALALFGVALCVLAERTGRIGAGICAHMTFNAITVVGLLAR